MYTVIFDIGRTNKKVYVFDGAQRVIHTESETFAETADDDGFPCDDLGAICAWTDETLGAAMRRFDVSRINFSTYGATLVHLNRDGRPTTPLYSYLKPATIPRLHEVYRNAGGPQSFHVQVGSPSLGMLNSGLQLLWLKHAKPKAFGQTRTSLHFAQYLSYRLTGVATSEFTSVGCHSCLWDFGRRRYHSWLAVHKLYSLLPRVGSAHTTLPGHAYGKAVEVGVGIHDSSAALLVHSRTQHEPFILVSTGTWAINFNPDNHTPLTAYELGRDCLTFMDPEGRAVKASRMFFGREHDVRVEELSKYYGVHPETYKLVRYVPELDPESARPRFKWSQLTAALPRGTGQHTSDPDFNAAYHRLMRELVNVLAEQIELIATPVAARHLIIDGGFAESEVFKDMLSRNFPKAHISVADNPIGSALGALLALDRPET